MTHSYLFVSALIALVGLAAVWMRRRHRRLILTSGALAAPTGTLDLIFVPEYWHPVHWIGPWFSLEGILFSFGNGCVLMALVAWRLPDDHADIELSPWAGAWRITIAMFLGVAVFALSWRGGAGSLMIMHAVFLGFVVMFVFLWRRGGFSSRVAWTGGIGFTLFYLFEVLLWYWLDPAMAFVWTAQDSYFLVLDYPPGLPIEELLWAFAYGALWSNLLLYGFSSRHVNAAPG